MNVPTRRWRLIGGMAFNALGDRQIQVEATTQSGPSLERGETVEVVSLPDHETAVEALRSIAGKRRPSGAYCQRVARLALNNLGVDSG
jgi:hypothetical protein